MATIMDKAPRRDSPRQTLASWLDGGEKRIGHDLLTYVERYLEFFKKKIKIQGRALHHFSLSSSSSSFPATAGTNRIHTTPPPPPVTLRTTTDMGEGAGCVQVTRCGSARFLATTRAAGSVRRMWSNTTDFSPAPPACSHRAPDKSRPRCREPCGDWCTWCCSALCPKVCR